MVLNFPYSTALWPRTCSPSVLALPPLFWAWGLMTGPVFSLWEEWVWARKHHRFTCMSQGCGFVFLLFQVLALSPNPLALLCTTAWKMDRKAASFQASPSSTKDLLVHSGICLSFSGFSWPNYILHVDEVLIISLQLQFRGFICPCFSQEKAVLWGNIALDMLQLFFAPSLSLRKLHQKLTEKRNSRLTAVV